MDSIPFISFCARTTIWVDTPDIFDTSACSDTLLDLNGTGISSLLMPDDALQIKPNPVVDYLQLKAR